MLERRVGIVAVLGSCLALCWVLHDAGLSARAILAAAGGATLLFLPIGDLILPLRGLSIGDGERLTLAWCVGYPAGATLHYLYALAGPRGGFWLVLVGLALAAAVRRYREARRGSAPDGAAPRAGSWAVVCALALLVPALFWIPMRDARPFEPTAQGLLYDHSIDYADHLAYYWELFREVPPAYQPTVAGLPAPRYHVLGFMPGLFFMRELGLDATEVHHFVAPGLRVLLLMGGLFVAVRLFTDQVPLAIASLVSVFGVLVAVGNALEGQVVDAAAPLSFFLTSESGGSGIVVWTTIAALLLWSERDKAAGRRVLLLASLLAGLSYGFKAQGFLLMAGAYCGALVLLAIRDREWDRMAALLVTLGAAAAVFLSWRAPLTRGLPYLTPGLFAQIYVMPTLTAARLGALGEALSHGLSLVPAPLDGMLATLLGVWKMLVLSPLLPLWLARLVAGWRRCGLAEATLGLACLLALPLGYAFSVKAIDGVLSPYEFIQAAQGLAFLAAVVNVVALAAFLRRYSSHAIAWTSALTCIAALSVVPLVLTGKTVRTPHRELLLGADEVCGLLYLRNVTPLDAVIITARGEGVPAQSRRLNYFPVVAGFAGRRTVLEYFWREVDPSTDRVRAIRRLFATSDANEAETILRRFRVTHILEYAGRPLGFVSPAVVTVYRRGSVRVYRFGEGVASSNPPARLPPAFGLSCEASHS